MRNMLRATAACALLVGPLALGARTQGRTPVVTLVAAPSAALAGSVDSNSPALWELVNGQPLLHVLTSVDGQANRSLGSRVTRLGAPERVTFVSHPGHGVWMEAIVDSSNDAWYGFYHNEVPAALCGRPDRMLPRIGAARSLDRGQSWEDLGIVLEAPPGQHVCGTPNRYFVGGVGDLSAMLDDDSSMLYLFFSQYSRGAAAQGVAVARMSWADRDAPAGRVDVWVDGAWLPPTGLLESDAEGARVTWQYPSGTPLVRPRSAWHDSDGVADAFWGASVHWNTALEQYVMLLNRTKDDAFSQEGVYISFAPRLDDPPLWSVPQRVLSGGTWYPQVIGLDTGAGTDKLAGARARLFVGGRSNSYIDFAYK